MERIVNLQVAWFPTARKTDIKLQLFIVAKKADPLDNILQSSIQCSIQCTTTLKHWGKSKEGKERKQV